ncbi:GDSL esterase/lipase 6 [Selaginella moellendorffii]|uniref:GDSL esterase/lipase 6 n=1 Tax=Selaginella moellendorffii TaxID=88036 RepID=UPI000D1C8594|nr:GDSL esterase/lipase 6 [Selaginella moellendorffii]|eukprot:XP_024535509.1 GDSL esterase/lipase 6 [Selaginella moellendorffii]
MGSHSSTLLLLCVANLVAYASALQYFPNLSTRKVPGLFVLGDSTVDAGNNLYISNPIVEVSVPPYGDTYFGHPTGRYTNGRTLPDFLATSLGLRFPDPYLKPDKWIAQGGLMSLNTQLAQFHNLTLARPNPEFYKESVFVFSMGANDIMGNYLADSTLQTQVTPQEFIVKSLSEELKDTKIVLAKTYDLTMSAIKFPQAFGYEDVKSACCGAGPFNAAVFCGDSYLKNDARTKQFQPYLCPTPSKSMFWDSIHPTEKSYWLYFRYMWYGDDNVVEPYNLAKLFEGAYIPQPPLPIHSSCLV